MNLEWDDDNIEHVGDHDVDPDEIEEALKERFLKVRGREERYLFLAQTEAGRYLTVVATSRREGVWRVITARDMNAHERRRYRTWKRRQQ